MDRGPKCQTWDQSRLPRHIACLRYSLAPFPAHQTLFRWYPRQSPHMARGLPLLSQWMRGSEWNSFISSYCPGWSSSRQFSGPCAFSGFHQRSLRFLGKSSLTLLMTPPSAVPSLIPLIIRQQPLHSPQSWIKSQAGQTLGICLSILSNLTPSPCFSERTIWEPPIYFLNNPLEEVLSFKLLGLTICQDLSWESHISKLASKASHHPPSCKVLPWHTGAPNHIQSFHQQPDWLILCFIWFLFCLCNLLIA